MKVLVFEAKPIAVPAEQETYERKLAYLLSFTHNRPVHWKN